MEKRTSITRLAMAAAIAALASSATAYAGVAVPYSSDLGVNYSLASDWTQQYDPTANHGNMTGPATSHRPEPQAA